MRSIFSGLVIFRVAPADGSLGLFRGRSSFALAIPFRPSMRGTVTGSGSSICDAGHSRLLALCGVALSGKFFAAFDVLFISSLRYEIDSRRAWLARDFAST